jgi:hypothetical protein
MDVLWLLILIGNIYIVIVLEDNAYNKTLCINI